jgi:hypothetical protein
MIIWLRNGQVGVVVTLKIRFSSSISEGRCYPDRWSNQQMREGNGMIYWYIPNKFYLNMFQKFIAIIRGSYLAQKLLKQYLLWM